VSSIILTDRSGVPLQSSGYDGADSSNVRSQLFIPTNSRRELNSYTRQELVRKVRALDANLGIYGRIIRKAGQNAVGKGIFPRPITRDKEFNKAAKRLIEEWGGMPGVYSIDDSRDFWEDQRQAAETLVGDGEFFSQLVYSPESGAPMVQPLDIFEIVQPIEREQGQIWEDGILVNEFLRPVAYGVRELSGPYDWRDFRGRVVPRRDMIHIFQRRRAKQLRGITWFYSGINQGIDALDLRALETGTAKLHSALGVVVKKNKGDAGKSGISARLEQSLGVSSDKPGQISEHFIRGAAIEYLASDEGIELVSSDRPSPNLREFIEFLYRDIAIATGLPIEVIYNLASLGGATARAVLEDAQWWFEMIQDKIVERHSRRIYVWRLAVAQHRGEIPVCRDPDWWACAWRGPAKLTVDMGRTAEANIKLVRNGMLSHERYYEERALDAQEELTSQMDFLQWLREECEERNLPIEWILEQQGPVAISFGGSSADNSNKDDE
jgi:Bacteriophage capsid protein